MRRCLVLILLLSVALFLLVSCKEPAVEVGPGPIIALPIEEETDGNVEQLIVIDEKNFEHYRDGQTWYTLSTDNHIQHLRVNASGARDVLGGTSYLSPAGSPNFTTVANPDNPERHALRVSGRSGSSHALNINLGGLDLNRNTYTIRIKGSVAALLPTEVVIASANNHDVWLTSVETMEDFELETRISNSLLNNIGVSPTDLSAITIMTDNAVNFTVYEIEIINPNGDYDWGAPENMVIPTPAPTPDATPDATATPEPTDSPEPTATPIPSPTPTPSPTPAPSPSPGATAAPTAAPTTAPTAAPTTAPTAAPTTAPTAAPTAAPTTAPTPVPTPDPTPVPVETPVPTLPPVPTPEVSIGPVTVYNMSFSIPEGTTGTHADILSQVAGIREAGTFTATVVAGNAIQLTDRQNRDSTIDILRTHFDVGANNTYTIRIRGNTSASSVGLSAVGDNSITLGSTSAGGNFELNATVTSVDLRPAVFGRGIRITTGDSTADLTIQQITITRN
ncbi:MAG: hypothetical protein FWE27_05865 [Defluviitaleaceae bacterium]|nr:hypothetical protein [Defluviitaleaceae bacterium]